MDEIKSPRLKTQSESARTTVSLLSAYDKYQLLKKNWLIQCCLDVSSTKPRPENPRLLDSKSDWVKHWADNFRAAMARGSREYKSNELFTKHLLQLHEEFCNFCYEVPMLHIEKPAKVCNKGTQTLTIFQDEFTQCEVEDFVKNVQCEFESLNNVTQCDTNHQEEATQSSCDVDGTTIGMNNKPCEEETEENTNFNNDHEILGLTKSAAPCSPLISSTPKLLRSRERLGALLKRSYIEQEPPEEPFRRFKVDSRLLSQASRLSVLPEEPIQHEKPCFDEHYEPSFSLLLKKENENLNLFSRNMSLLSTKIETLDESTSNFEQEAIFGFEYDDSVEEFKRQTSLKQGQLNCPPALVIKQQTEDVPAFENVKHYFEQQTSIKQEPIEDAPTFENIEHFLGQTSIKQEPSNCSPVASDHNFIKQEPKDITWENTKQKSSLRKLKLSPDSSETKDNSWPFKYTQFNKVFKREEKSSDHKLSQSQNSDALFQCTHCKKLFKRKYHLQQHLTMHTDEKHLFLR